MGHGDRWKAIEGRRAADNSDEAVARRAADLFRRISDGGVPILGTQRLFTPPEEEYSSAQTSQVYSLGFFLPVGPVGLCAVTSLHRETKSIDFQTAYPVPVEGVAHRVTVIKVREDCDGFEGWVSAETHHGHPVEFFAADYFIHPQRYRANAEINVSLSMIAYSLMPAEKRELVIDDPETIRRHRERLLKLGLDTPPNEPVRIQTEDVAMLLPLEGWEPFDYKFQGRVRNVEKIVDGEMQWHRFTITFGPDVDLSVIASKHVFADAKLSDGQAMMGRGCIMGRLADCEWPTEPSGVNFVDTEKPASP